MTNGPCYLVDASIYIFRAWFSFDDQFRDPQGRPTNACYGFARFLGDLLSEAEKAPVELTFDIALGSSFRNEIYADYKANRPPAPEDLKRQFYWCQQLGESLGLGVYAHERFEADDFVATLAKQARDQNHQVIVVSADKDLAQVLQTGDIHWDFRRRRTPYNKVAESFGVAAEQIADFLAITGDAVDNIPGVKGVGPKTAAGLLRHFSTMDNMLERLEEIQFLSMRGAKQLAKKLAPMADQMQMARRLTRLREDVPLPGQILQRHAPDWTLFDTVMDSAGFGPALRKRFERLLSR